MKKEQTKKTENKRKELSPVNVHNQEEMIALGIHPKYKVICNYGSIEK